MQENMQENVRLSEVAKPNNIAPVIRESLMTNGKTPLERLLEQYDSIDQNDSQGLLGFLEQLSNLVKSPPDKSMGYSVYDSRLDPQDYYAWGLHSGAQSIASEVHDLISQRGSGAILDKPAIRALVSNFRNTPRAVRGASGAEGVVTIYRHPDGRLTVYKRFDDTSESGRNYKFSRLPALDWVNRDSIPRKLSILGDQLYSLNSEEEGGRLHSFFIELGLATHLSRVHPADHVLAEITQYSHSSMVSSSYIESEVMSPSATMAGVLALIKQRFPNRCKWVGLVMEHVPVDMQLAETNDAQFGEAVRQWAEFIHDMAQAGLVNLDKPHAEITLKQNAGIQVKTYDIGLAMVLDRTKQLRALEICAPHEYQAAKALFAQLDWVQQTVFTSKNRGEGVALVAQTELLREARLTLNLLNSLPLTDTQKSTYGVQERIRNLTDVLNSAESEHQQNAQDAELNSLIKEIEQVRSGLQKYVDRLIPVEENANSGMRALSIFFEAFQLPNLGRAEALANGFEELETIFQTRPASLVRPFVNVLHAYYIQQKTRYDELIEIFHYDSLAGSTEGPKTFEDSVVLDKWNEVRLHFGKLPLAISSSGSTPLPATSSGARFEAGDESNGAMEEQLGALKTRIEQSEAMLTIANGNLALTQGYLAELSATAEGYRVQAEALALSQAEALRIATARIVDLEAQIKDLTATRDQALARVTVLEGDSVRLAGVKDEREALLSTLQAQLAEMTATLADNQQQLEALQKALIDAQAQTTSLKATTAPQTASAQTEKKADVSAEDMRIDKSIAQEFSSGKSAYGVIEALKERNPRLNIKYLAQRCAQYLTNNGNPDGAQHVLRYGVLSKLQAEYREMWLRARNNKLNLGDDADIIDGFANNSEGFRLSDKGVATELRALIPKLQRIYVSG